MKEELRDFYIKKGQTMTREEMMTYIFGNSIADKLNNREKELMSEDEQKIFNTAYEEGWDDGYSDGIKDRNITAHRAYVNGIKNTMKWFERLLIRDARIDKNFVQHVIMEWATVELLTED